MSFLKQQAINSSETLTITFIEKEKTVQEGRKGFEQFFFPSSLFGIIFSIFFYLSDRLEMGLRIMFFSIFRLKKLLRSGKMRFKS